MEGTKMMAHVLRAAVLREFLLNHMVLIGEGYMIQFCAKVLWPAASQTSDYFYICRRPEKAAEL